MPLRARLHPVVAGIPVVMVPVGIAAEIVHDHVFREVLHVEELGRALAQGLLVLIRVALEQRARGSGGQVALGVDDADLVGAVEVGELRVQAGRRDSLAREV